MSETIVDRREKRRKQTAEVFTPNELVNQMLNKLPKDVWKKNKTFCDTACGNGNFLVWILLRKLQRGHKSLDALKSVYGADIMKDNIGECRLRLLKIISLWEPVTKEHIAAVFQRIVWINQNKYPNGSLDYDWSFENKVKWADVDAWMENIHQRNKLEDVELPFDEETFNPSGIDCIDFD